MALSLTKTLSKLPFFSIGLIRITTYVLLKIWSATAFTRPIRIFIQTAQTQICLMHSELSIKPRLSEIASKDSACQSATLSVGKRILSRNRKFMGMFRFAPFGGTGLRNHLS